MKKHIVPKIDHEVLSLVTDVAFSTVPTWYGASRTSLQMDMIIPKVIDSDKKRPLLVWFCGGGYRIMDKSVWLPELMTYARHGFIIASPEYRTVGESGFPGCMIDGKAAIRYLKAHAEEYGIDVNRIAVMGESGGGTIASLIGTTGGIDEFEKGDFLQYDSRVNAVIDYYGIVDMNNSPVRVTGRDVPPWILEDFLEIDYSKDDAAKASAINYVTENTPPFLIFHGSEDQAVPTVQSERLYEKLQEKGVESDLYILDGAMHGEDAFYQNEITEIVENWLRKVM